MDEGRPLPCFECGFSEHVDGAQYCQKCGSAVFFGNLCVNDHCSMNYDDEQEVPIPDDALFCPYCGEESLFSRKGVFEPQNAQK